MIGIKTESCFRVLPSVLDGSNTEADLSFFVFMATCGNGQRQLQLFSAAHSSAVCRGCVVYLFLDDGNHHQQNSSGLICMRISPLVSHVVIARQHFPRRCQLSNGWAGSEILPGGSRGVTATPLPNVLFMSAPDLPLVSALVWKTPPLPCPTHTHTQMQKSDEKCRREVGSKAECSVGG